MQITVVSGGFDPLHSGHIDYLQAASKIGEKLIVLLNSDEWLIKKKGKYFLSFYERKTILDNLEMVDAVIGFDDDETGSCINGLKLILDKYPDDQIIFCNGGDRSKENIPEQTLENIEFIFGVGTSIKKNSSSKILQEWKNDYESRVWGEFTELYLAKGIKVKELVIKPGKKISYQKHNYRSEIWFIASGSCSVKKAQDVDAKPTMFELGVHDLIHVKKGECHQIINDSKEECRIIEIQYGAQTIESDIERFG